ncbi:phospholipid carrier-dependent glycosyltransferase [Actinomyces slackii]|uniref:Polyprenol-phosphate-mannose--protein mannosyltransferase n=1 Tax=Actinomyces slackii TaxID=52774 RepID=A0A448K9P8_9ACTO|nr:phospholipid carrier-dependent glycosyltransferase [Actinomyces slackii]VEG73683.1 Predicted membrane-bound dolichyl-phosphate-mannose-protein mannosyltransferase [Actinomyces slackii]
MTYPSALSPDEPAGTRPARDPQAPGTEPRSDDESRSDDARTADSQSPGPDAPVPQAQAASKPSDPEQPAPAAQPPGTEADRAPATSEPRTENQLRHLLGLEPLEWALPRALRIRGWVATAVVGVIAALTRLVGLSHPSTLIFDEIYYVKDSYALWTLGYEAQWADGSDARFAAGDFSGMSTEPSFVVHPQFGKWLLGLGMQVFGADSAVGWRIVPALAGILTVVLLARLTMRMTHSPVLAGLAGLFLAIDGVGITESRIGLLDVFIGLFATLAMYCLVRDREASRARLAKDLAGTPAAPRQLAPRAHLRPWLWATGATLGLACSVKWSGLYLLAVVGILVVVWDTSALRSVKAKAWFLEGLISRGFGDFIRLVPTALVVYVGLWWSWFAHDRSYKRGWAVEQIARSAEGTLGEAERMPYSWLPNALNDLIEYHRTIYTFHVGLGEHHPYEAGPAGWLLQWRPTSFYWPEGAELAGTNCGSDRCIQAITSIGNIPVWWAAIPALLVVLAMGIGGRDWRAWVPLAGYLGLYVPWFQYPDRTIFTFYTVAFVPFVVLVLTLALGQGMGMLKPVPGSREARAEELGLREGWIGPGLPAPRGLIARFLGAGDTHSRARGRWSPRRQRPQEPLGEQAPQQSAAQTARLDDGAPHASGHTATGVEASSALTKPADSSESAKAVGAVEESAQPEEPAEHAALTKPADSSGSAEAVGAVEESAQPEEPATADAQPEESAEGAAPSVPAEPADSSPTGLARVLRLTPEWTGVPTWRLRNEGVLLTVLLMTLALSFAILWWPIWTGQTVSYTFWRMHMLLESWI